MTLIDHLPCLGSIIPAPRPDLQPLADTIPLTPLAALLPPLIYYLALLLLPPFPQRPPTTHSPLTILHPLISPLRNTLALISALLFLRLPLNYHVPFSVGLTYQLSLVGLYGGSRVLDIFFISRYLFDHIPRRINHHHASRDDITPAAQGGDADSYFSLHFLQAGKGEAVTETAEMDEGLPEGWWDRMSWALEVELSMRGAGLTWSSADVRHTKRTWRPTAQDRIHSIVVHVAPVLVICWGVVRGVCVRYLLQGVGFDGMPLSVQLGLTAALGGFLMGLFSLGYSLCAILMAPLAPHPLAYFPPLYSERAWDVKSVREFWSYGWHRLFSRLFLVYGVWPGEWVERKLLGKSEEESADVGKVFGAFVCSAFVHSYAGHAVLGGWEKAGGEAWFFAENGLAVVLEEAVDRFVRVWRKARGGEDAKIDRWWDGIVGRVWWISVLLWTGRNFARGWCEAGLVREMAGA